MTAEVHGNRNVPHLNRNGSKRNLNLNWNDDRWMSTVGSLLAALTISPYQSFGCVDGEIHKSFVHR